MPRLKNEARPSGQAEDYRFVRNLDSGRMFKARQEAQTTDNGRPAISISISPTGEDGKALLNEGQAPDVYVVSHTFTEVETTDPAFDLDARVASILDTAIAEKERDLAARELIAGVADKWKGNKPLALDKRA